jgi:hypothetical protein
MTTACTLPDAPIPTPADAEPAGVARPHPDARRDPYVDLLRAGSLLVVVLWHWVFTVLVWKPDGPHASNPIGRTPGLWALTWVLQVMPVFFFVGGYAHRRTYESTEAHAARTARTRDTGDERSGVGRTFLRRRLGRLVVPTLALLAVAGLARVVAVTLFPDATWVGRGLVLLISPLWFLGVYLVLVLTTPLAIRAHRRHGVRVLVVLAAAAVTVDVLRFRLGVPYVEWLNFALVYGFAHQLGFWWPALVAAGGRRAVVLTAGGFAGLAVLTNLGSYPRSMVGVPGEPFSNVAPPTVCLLALGCFQVGLVLLARERATAWLDRGALARPVTWANENSMTVFLWHFTGYGVFLAIATAAGLGLHDQPDLHWWLERPLWFVGPALCTIPLLRVFRHLEMPGGRGMRAR